MDVQAKLVEIREAVAGARSMPMSASCVVNRNEVLAAIDEVIGLLPDEFAEAQRVLDTAEDNIAGGRAEADRIIREAHNQATYRAEDSETVRVAQDLVARLRAEAEAEAAALRRETDVFVDSRMASFESVLHKTASQVRIARLRLSERSSLDTPERSSLDTPERSSLDRPPPTETSRAEADEGEGGPADGRGLLRRGVTG